MKTQNPASNRRIIVVCVAAIALLMLAVSLLPLTAFARIGEDQTTPTDIGLAYVSLPNDSQVAVIDTTSHTFVGAIDVATSGCYSPYQVAMSPNEDLVFVACNSSVAVIDTSTNTVIENINLPGVVYDIAFVQDGEYALVTVPSFYTVVVINTTTYAIVDSISILESPERVAAHPYLDRAYVASGYGEVHVIDTNTFSEVESIYLGDSYLSDVVASPDGQLIFVGRDAYPGAVHVIDAVTNSLITTINLPYAVYELSITPDGQTLFGGAGYSGIQVFDVSTLSYETTISVGGEAYNPVVNCAGTELYVGGGYNNNVPVINISTYTVTNYISLGGYYGPRGIAICPDSAISGVALLPPAQINDGALGETAVHELTLVNATDAADSYDLTLGAFTWDSALSTPQVGPLQPGQSVTVTVSVTVPVSADWYDEDSVTIYATSVTSPSVYSDTAVAITQAFSPAVITVSPNTLSSTQYFGDITTQTLGISNGNGITLTFQIKESNTTNSVFTLVDRVTSNVLVLGDGGSENVIVPFLMDAGFNITMGPLEYQYDGTNPSPTSFNAVLLLDGGTFQNDMPLGGQLALRDYVTNGGGLVVTEWFAYEISEGRYAVLSDLQILARFNGGQGSEDYTVVAPNHPVTAGLPPNFAVPNHGFNVGQAVNGGLSVIAGSISGDAVVAAEIEGGRVVQMATAASYFGFNPWNMDMQQLLINSINWVAGYGGDVPWTHQVPVSGTVATDSTIPIQVVFDASSIQPGTYTANLLVESNDPFSPTVTLPVSMTVQPTANMGWVEGIITDAGTGLPLEATIIAQGQPYTITSDANTGYYQLWLDSGSYTLQVSADGYVTESQTVNIVAEQGITQDFDLVLNVPVINVTHDDMAVAQDVGQMTSRALTITNAGPALLAFDILRTAIGFTPWAYVRDTLNLPVLDTAVTSLPTGPLADVPSETIIGDNHVLIIQDTYPWGYDSIQQILAANNILYDQVDSSYMASIDLSAYELVILPSYQSGTFYTNWNTYIERFETYVEAGGALWLSGTTQGDTPLAPGGVLNNWGPDGYNNVVLPSHPWVANVPVQIQGNSASHNYFTSLYPGSDSVVHSVNYNEATLVDYRLGGGRVFLTGQTLEIAWAGNWDAAPILENSLLDMYYWAPGDVSWLVVTPISGTVAGYSSEAVAVTFDATGVQPGVYTANMILNSNDTVNSSVIVPVTMTVSAAPGMGQVIGTVTDLWTDDPLTATVQLVGVYTDTADPDYSIWANAGSHTLIASAEGYMTTTYTITIPANGMVVQDIALEPAQPRLEDMPAELVITAVPGYTFPQTFTLANTGPLPLDYTWHEVAPNLRAPDAPVDLTGKVIMFDRAHGQGDLNNFTTLAAAINNAGGLLTVNFAFPITADILNDVDVLWVDCCGYTNWTFAELQVVDDWLEAGGAVLVHSENNPAAADVAGIYNITYECCQYSSGTTTDILPHPTTAGVSAIYLDYSYDALNYTAAADVTVRDTNGYAQAVAQEQNGGKMVVIDSWLFNDYRITEEDNLLFAMNVMNWLADPAYGDVPWLAVAPVSGTIAGHSSQEMTVMVDTTGLTLGTHEAVLALEHNDPAQESPLLLPVTVQVVEQTAAVTLTPLTASDSGLPGTPVTYTLTLQNSGNGPDRFAISVSGEWTATPAIVTTDELLPGQSQQFTVVVQIPADAEPDSVDDTAVTATSQFNNTVAQTATLTTTAISSMVRIYLPVMLKP